MSRSFRIFCYVVTSYFQAYELIKDSLINSPSDNEFPHRAIEEMNQKMMVKISVKMLFLKKAYL